MVEDKVKNLIKGETIKLYARDAKKNIIIWMLDLDGSSLIIRNGKLNASLVKNKINLGGNLNNTIGIDKIYRSVLRRVKDKRKNGYVFIEEIEGHSLNNLPMVNTDASGRALPMLAAKFKQTDYKRLRGKYFLWQTKYNGVRATAEWNEEPEPTELFGEPRPITYLSRENSEYGPFHLDNNLSKVLNYLSHNFGLDEYKTDGELFIYGKTLDYIRTCVPIKKENDSRFSIPSGDTNEVVYVIYDIMIDRLIQSERAAILADLKKFIIYENISNIEVDCGITVTLDDALKLSQNAYNSGMEGGIIRDLNSVYKFGSRSVAMRKIKFEKEKEFKIIDIMDKGTRQVGNTTMYDIAVILLDDESGRKFEAVPGNRKKPWTSEMKLKLYESKKEHIGKMATVVYRDVSKDGLPQQANFITLRDYE